MNKLITEEQIDVAVATAKKFPRNEAQCVLRARSLALMDRETAAECFYTLRRGGQIIEGISVRMAEIIAHCWGNIHKSIKSRINSNTRNYARNINQRTQRNGSTRAEREADLIAKIARDTGICL